MRPLVLHLLLAAGVIALALNYLGVIHEPEPRALAALLVIAAFIAALLHPTEW
ncbi:hypothetical protein [Streptomyces sp. AV19]|uniref:hypothetical protein n=1 Tax=Streptomyces sp. AV19 TaxID=2793068 RepID=UPI002413250D|nr:hypothetical protein [Streptomyces sp. AV19]MDG4535307.1 hypothetical protein [Streptomyces sp. AV19]